MRIAWATCVALLGASACTSGSPTGLYLHLTGSGTASSVEVLVAGPATMVAQRTSDVPTQNPTEVMVPYFAQRTTSGVIPGPIDLAAGYTLVLEAGSDVDPANLVPIVIARGAGDAIVAVGVVPNAGADAMPTAAPLTIDTTRAQLAEVPMIPNGLPAGVAKPPTNPGDLAVFTCSGGGASGLAWHDSTGRELRLMVPDAGQTDATSRPLDIDCDGVAVSATNADDCDDLRADVNPGQAPVCDGIDHTCSDQLLLVVPCTGQVGCGMGAGLCNNMTAAPPVQCVTPACAGDAFVSCTDPVDVQDGRLCTPTVGQLPLTTAVTTACQGGCKIRVERAPDSVHATLSRQATSGFNSSVTLGPGQDQVFLRVNGTIDVPQTVAPVVIDLVAVDAGGNPTYLGVQVFPASGADTCGSSVSQLTCQVGPTPPQ